GLIAAASHQNGFWRYVVERRQPLDQGARLWLRIAIQSCDGFITSGSPGKFVRVHALEGRLPSGMLVGFEGDDFRARQFADPAHSRAPTVWFNTASRRVTALAWASRPSISASVTAVGPNPNN